MSNASDPRKLRISALPKFEVDVYTRIPSGELIVYSAHYLMEQGMEITLEDIVSVCFRLFPHKFGLKKYPKWPDSALVSRRWRDARKKGTLSAGTNHGYKLTSKGLSLVKKVAKTLGLAAPKAVVGARPTQINKKTKPLIKKTQPTNNQGRTLRSKLPDAVQKGNLQPVRKDKNTGSAPDKKIRSIHAKSAKSDQVKQATLPARIKKISPIRRKKKSVAPSSIKQAKSATPVQVKKSAQSARNKKMSPLQPKKATPLSAPVKQAAAPEKKIRSVTPINKTALVQVKKVPLPARNKKKSPLRANKASPIFAPIKQAQAVKLKATPAGKTPAMPVSKPAKKTRSVRPYAPILTKKHKEDKARIHTQIKKGKPIQVKETKPAEPINVQPGKVKKAPPKKSISFTASHVPREAKERAAKFTRMMERSDAYIHYKKHGINSKIKEFDFRSLLLCTMESSPETLARNVELFKGYAGMHNRQDLIVFLVFCGNKFPHLLKPQNKPARKAKK